MMVSFVLSFFPRDVLDEILNLIESVSEDFPSYFCKGSHTQPCRGCGVGLLISNSSVVSAGIEVNGVVQQELCRRNLRNRPPSRSPFRGCDTKGIPTAIPI